jgi:hypothetical protein
VNPFSGDQAVGPEYRTVRQIIDQPGTVILDGGATSVSVRFSLVQIQKFVDGIPDLRTAHGTITFPDRKTASKLLKLGDAFSLRGAGIEAMILLLSIDEFKVTGFITSDYTN